MDDTLKQMGYTSDLESRFNVFTPEQTRYLCLYGENRGVVHYLEFIVEKKANLTGLFYEISQIHGNWTFKDRVLPGLFQEVYDILLTIQKKIEEIYSEDFEITFLESHSYRDRNINRRRYNLLKYLINQFREQFIDYGRSILSEHYTHLYLNKLIKKIDIRIINVLREYQDAFILECELHAKQGLRRIIIDKLKNLECPYTNNLKGISYLYRFEEEGLLKIIRSYFKPSCENTEYHVGLTPIWRDLPGKGTTTYYFDFYNNNNEGKNLVLILDERLSSYEYKGFPGIMQDRPKIIDIFAQLEQKELFEEWFNSLKVKKEIIRTFSSRIVYETLEKKESDDDKIFEKSTSELKENLSIIEEYYGLTYDFAEVKNIITTKELEWLERSVYIDEENQRRKEIVKNLFPELIEAEKEEVI